MLAKALDKPNDELLQRAIEMHAFAYSHAHGKIVFSRSTFSDPVAFSDANFGTHRSQTGYCIYLAMSARRTPASATAKPRASCRPRCSGPGCGYRGRSRRVARATPLGAQSAERRLKPPLRALRPPAGCWLSEHAPRALRSQPNRCSERNIVNMYTRNSRAYLVRGIGVLCRELLQNAREG